MKNSTPTDAIESELECGCFEEAGKIVEYCPDHTPRNRAYALLQSEGHAEPRQSRDPYDYENR